MKRPTADIFDGTRERYACINWCHHLDKGVTLGGEDLCGFLEDIPLVDVLAKFTSTSMDIWLNNSLSEGHPQLHNLRSTISELKVGETLSCYPGVVNLANDLF